MKEPTIGFRLEWNDAVVKTANAAMRRARLELGKRVLQHGNVRVPYRTGNLMRSGAVSGSGARVTYGGGDVFYGQILHAHPEWHYNLGRSARWFEEAVTETADEVEATVAREVHGAIGD